MIFKETQIPAAKAREILNGLASRLESNPDGTWAIPTRISKDELILIKCLCSLLVVKPAFSPEHLFDGFTATLKSNGLISNQEIYEHKHNLRPLVLMFAISIMHNTIVQINDKETVKLKGGASDDTISIRADVPLASNPKIFFSSDIFLADLKPENHCTQELLGCEWSMDLEVGRDQKLSPLV